MILDDKVIMYSPPPAYNLTSPSLHTISSTSPNLSTLPPHILLQILHQTFPHSSRIPDQDTPELQRKTLYWLSTSLRLVNRALYTACMHILRSTYLRAYQALLRPPYTSDPFPISSGPPAYEHDGSPILIPEESPLQTIQRETLVLDRFITLKVREDVFSDESSLHLEGDDKFRDLFNLAQPQARLEDLVRICGIREGVISIPGMPIANRRSTTGMYASSINSSSQYSFQPPTSPFHDSNAVAITYPHIPAPPPVIIPNMNKPPGPPTGFFSTLRKLTTGSSPSSPSPQSTSSPTPLHPKPFPFSIPNSINPISFSSLSITLTFQSVRLIQKRRDDGSRKCVAEVHRNRVPGTMAGGGRRETLEVLAEGLVRTLKEGLEERSVAE